MMHLNRAIIQHPIIESDSYPFDFLSSIALQESWLRKFTDLSITFINGGQIA